MHNEFDDIKIQSYNVARATVAAGESTTTTVFMPTTGIFVCGAVAVAIVTRISRCCSPCWDHSLFQSLMGGLRRNGDCGILQHQHRQHPDYRLIPFFRRRWQTLRLPVHLHRRRRRRFLNTFIITDKQNNSISNTNISMNNILLFTSPLLSSDDTSINNYQHQHQYKQQAHHKSLAPINGATPTSIQIPKNTTITVIITSNPNSHDIQIQVFGQDLRIQPPNCYPIQVIPRIHELRTPLNKSEATPCRIIKFRWMLI